MKLDRLILVNWGALRSGEYPMGNMSLLTGPTGSGKSTMLDALQTVMTAVYQNVFSYNPGQDETTQSARNGKTKRTLWSYIVGAEDNLFARPDGAHGYVAAVFKPSEGETGKEFTALVAAAARVDGSGDRRQAVSERLMLLIVDDAALKIDDLISLDADNNMQVVEVDKAETHLKSRYPKVTNFRDTKREYLCQLYGRFRGQKTVPFPEAEAAAKAWSQSIAHKPIGSVDELVKTQILEFDQQQLTQRISQIGDLMRQVHNLRLEGERLRENVVRLEGIGASILDATNAYERAIQYQVLAAKRTLRDDEQAIDLARRSVDELKEKIQSEQMAAERADKERKALNASLVKIEAQLSGIPAANQKALLDARMDTAQQNVKAALEELVEALSQVESLQTTARQVIGMEFPQEFRALRAAAGKVAESLSKVGNYPISEWKVKLRGLAEKQVLGETVTVMAIIRDLETLTHRFDALHQALAGASDSFSAAVSEQRGELKLALALAEQKEADASARKKNLAEGGADYPKPIQVALAAFRSDLPGARVQVLCDLIEPANEEWQAAIEGYMGMARFNFVVHPDWEGRAIEFVRQRQLRASIIQGSLCAKNTKPDRVHSESIIHELVTEHPIARNYLMDQFGGVVKVYDVEQLRFTSRGVMKDGKAAGSRTMYNASHESLVFGKAQQEKARQLALKSHEDAVTELQTLRTANAQLTGLLALVDKLKLPSFDARGEVESAVDEIERVWKDLKQLDLTEVEKLTGEKAVLEIQISHQEAAIRRADRLIGKYQDVQREQELLIGQKGGNLPGKRQRVIEELQKLQALCQVNESLSYIELEKQVDDLVERTSVSQALQDSTLLQVKAATALGDVRQTVAGYNQNARSVEQLDFPYSAEHRDDNFAPVYGLLVRLLSRVREQLKVQRDTGLYKNVEELRQAAGSFRDVFTKQFCYEIRNAVDNGVKTLRALNTELDKLKFGTDKFHIDWSAWVPEYKEYYDFFSAAYDLSEAQESGDLFTSDLSPENCAVRDQLVALLLSNEQERALKELQRVADYRNYRRYEIWKESDTGSRLPLSEWGTGSGGQLETPAYIVRAAVVTNRLKHFDKGTNLKLLVNDESFAKMDERRAHDVIKFIRDSLGMQLICAMPTKHAGAIKSEFTKEWCFTRTAAEGNGEVDFISEADERDLNTDRLRELWDKRRQEVRLQAQLLFEAEEEQLIA